MNVFVIGEGKCEENLFVIFECKLSSRSFEPAQKSTIPIIDLLHSRLER
jgi:hypothetical protein